MPKREFKHISEQPVMYVDATAPKGSVKDTLDAMAKARGWQKLSLKNPGTVLEMQGKIALATVLNNQELKTLHEIGATAYGIDGEPVSNVKFKQDPDGAKKRHVKRKRILNKDTREKIVEMFEDFENNKENKPVVAHVSAQKLPDSDEEVLVVEMANSNGNHLAKANAQGVKLQVFKSGHIWEDTETKSFILN